MELEESSSSFAALKEIQQTIESVTAESVTAAQAAAEENNNPSNSQSAGKIGDALDTEVHPDQIHRQQERNYWSRSIWVQWFLFGATFLAFAAAGYYAHIASQQKDVMELQLLAIGAQNRTMSQQIVAMNDTLAEIRRQTPFFEKSAIATERQANISSRSADVAETAIRITGTADFGIERVTCSPSAFSVDTIIRLTYKNIGGGPATGVVTRSFLGFYGGNVAKPSGPDSESTVGPGEKIESIGLKVGTVTIAGLSGDQMVKIMNDKVVSLHSWGWVRYTDRFRRAHLFIYDSVYAPDAAAPCTFQVIREVSLPKG